MQQGHTDQCRALRLLLDLIGESCRLPGNMVVREGVPSACWTACGPVTGKHTKSLFTVNVISGVFVCIIHCGQELERVMSSLRFCSLDWQHSHSLLPFCCMHAQSMIKCFKQGDGELPMLFTVLVAPGCNFFLLMFQKYLFKKSILIISLSCFGPASHWLNKEKHIATIAVSNS